MVRKLVNEVRQRHDIVHLSTKVRSVEGRTSSTNALDSRMQQGESVYAMQPIHNGTISSFPFLSQQEGKPFVEYRSLFVHASK